MPRWPFKVRSDDNGRCMVAFGEGQNSKTYYPEELSAIVLEKMKKIAEERCGREVTKCLVTVPAYFNITQKQATKDAC